MRRLALSVALVLLVAFGGVPGSVLAQMPTLPNSTPLAPAPSLVDNTKADEPIVWFSADLLLWNVGGQRLPPLVTTSPL